MSLYDVTMRNSRRRRHHFCLSLPRCSPIVCRILSIASLSALVGCQSLVWDPTNEVSSTEGHLTSEERPSDSRRDLRGAGGIALGDDAPARPPDSIQSGTGTFVRPVAAPPSAGQSVSGPDVSLNFDNTDIREVVKIILGDVLEVSYTLDPAVQGTASLTTARPLSRDLLIPTLETLLRMNNAALVESGGRFEVVPVSNAVQGRVVPQLGGSSRALPEGYSVQVVPLQYIGAAEMTNILEPLAPEGSIVRIDTLRNLVVLAGTGPEMNSMLDTIQMFDVDWMAGLSVGFFSLEYAKVNDVVTQLETLLADESVNSAKGLFRFVPVESANALLVVSPQQSYLARIEDWIERLDMAEASGSAAQRLYVYRVRHGDAENLADILTTLFSEGGGGSSGARRSVGGVAPGREQASIGGDGTASGSGATGSASRGATSSTLTLSSEVSIVADIVNNSLLVRSSPRDYKKILDALKQLDIVPLQVLVEATIVEIQLTGSLRYGVQWRFKGPAIEGYQGRQSLTQGNNEFPSPTFPGFNWSVVLQPSTIKATLTALAEDNLVNVLSSPTVMVMDNQEAKIEVGDEVPILTTAQQGTSDTDRILNQIEYKQTGVQLSVTPRVTPGGLVQMQIDQQVSSVLEDVGPLGSPSFRNRTITSNVAVRSNQAVVLGGLIQDDTSSGKSGVPGLYRAPIVGSLFGNTTKTARRTELVVVLTPRVIAGDSDIDAVTRDFRRKVKNLDPRF